MDYTLRVRPKIGRLGLNLEVGQKKKRPIFSAKGRGRGHTDKAHGAHNNAPVLEIAL